VNGFSFRREAHILKKIEQAHDEAKMKAAKKDKNGKFSLLATP
jgi:hypothetical protein